MNRVQNSAPPRLGASLLSAAMVLALLVSTARGDKSDVSQIDLFKNTFFIQFGTDAPVLQRDGFTAQVHVYPDFPGNILSASFAPPAGPLRNMAEDGFGNFAFGAIYATQSERDAAFPAGTYSFDLQTVTPPPHVTTAMDFIDQPPQTVPKLLNPDWYSVVLQFNSNQDYTFFWNNFAGFQNGTSGVGFEIVDIFNQLVFPSQLVFFPATQLTLPGGTLEPDQFYIGRLKFGNFLLEQDGSIDLFSYTVFTTEFIISAVDGPPVIQGPFNITVTEGQLFIYVISATNAPGSFSVANLPPELLFAADFGLIGGFPKAGTIQLPLNATNSLGTGSATLTLTVLPAPPLAITSSTTAAGRVGEPFKFQVHAPGATLNARLSTTGLPPGLMADELTGLISGTPTAAGRFQVALKVTDGNAEANGTLDLEFASDPAFLNIRSAHSVTLKPGQSFSYKIDAASDSGSADDAKFNIIGALPPGLTFDPATGIISGTYTGGAAPKTDGASVRSGMSPDRASVSGGALIGSIQLFASNSRGTATIPLAFFLAPTGAVNISTRMGVGTGDNVIIGGFIVTGNAPKKLLIRGIGPSLERVGITGALQDPILELHGSAGLLATNDNWKSDHQKDIADTTIPPSDDREPAIVGAFQPGNYTAIVRGKNNGTGIGLVELYDLGTASLETSSNATLAQISTRGTVLSGDNVMIGGFIISDITTKVIVRAIGPSLTQFGVPGALENTTLELFDSNGTSFAFNDDWKDPHEQAIRDTTVPPTDDREAAIVATLSPGSYTAIVRGKNESTGVALVEVYALQ